MRHGDEVERVSAVVVDLDERLLGVGLHDRADGAGGPSAGVGQELDDIEDRVLWISHGLLILAAIHGMSTQVEVRRGGPSPSVIQVVTTGLVAPLGPSTITTTS